MKKSQALAALALAFALGLGVVAPVANIYAAEETTPAVITCNGELIELQNAITNVTENNTYKTYKDLAEKLAVASARVATQDVVAVSHALIDTTATPNTGAYTAVPAIATPAANASLEAVIKAAEDATFTITTTINGVTKTKTVSYALISNYFDALYAGEDTQANNTVAANIRFDNIVSALKALGFTNAEDVLQTAGYTSASVVHSDFGTVAGNSASVILSAKQLFASGISATEVSGFANVSLRNLYNAVNDAKETLEAYNDLRDALLALDPQTLGTVTVDRLEAAVASATAADGTIADLQTIESEISSVTTAWSTVSGRIGDKNSGLVYISEHFDDYGKNQICRWLDHEATDEDEYKGLLQVLNEGFELVHEPTWTYAELVGATPENPGDDQPGDPSVKDPIDVEPGTNDGDDKKPAASDDNKAETPNTGIAGSTNGTASSTIAIVAGIATTLTAAGAGVVAYRNARRSGEEA